MKTKEKNKQIKLFGYWSILDKPLKSYLDSYQNVIVFRSKDRIVDIMNIVSLKMEKQNYTDNKHYVLGVGESSCNSFSQMQ